MSERSFAGFTYGEQLYVGFFGRAFRAYAASGSEVCLTELDPSLAQTSGFAEVLTARSGVLARLDHPNVVGTRSVGRSPAGNLIVVTNRVDGRVDVAELVNPPPSARVPPGQGLPLAIAAGIASQMLAGLAEAEMRGITHGAVHPRSVVIDRGGVVKVDDFAVGQALAVAGARAAESALFKGFAGFLAPEVALGDEPDRVADVYAAGAVLFAMVTGRPPPGEPGDIPVGHPLQAVFERALATDRGQRYRGARELASALAAALATRGTTLASPPEVAAYAREVLGHAESNRDRAPANQLSSRSSPWEAPVPTSAAARGPAGAQPAARPGAAGKPVQPQSMQPRLVQVTPPPKTVRLSSEHAALSALASLEERADSPANSASAGGVGVMGTGLEPRSASKERPEAQTEAQSEAQTVRLSSEHAALSALASLEDGTEDLARTDTPGNTPGNAPDNTPDNTKTAGGRAGPSPEPLGKTVRLSSEHAALSALASLEASLEEGAETPAGTGNPGRAGAVEQRPEPNPGAAAKTVRLASEHAALSALASLDEGAEPAGNSGDPDTVDGDSARGYTASAGAAAPRRLASEHAALAALSGLDPEVSAPAAAEVPTASAGGPVAAAVAESAAPGPSAAPGVAAVSVPAGKPMPSGGPEAFLATEQMARARLRGSRRLMVVAWFLVAAGAAAVLVWVLRTQGTLLEQAEERAEEAQVANREALRRFQAAQPQSGQMSIDSQPDEAAVWMLLGRAPLETMPLSATMVHELRLEFTGYRPLDLRVTGEHWTGVGTSAHALIQGRLRPGAAGRDQPVAAAPPPPPPAAIRGLPKGRGKIRVESDPPGAQVWLLVGFTPDVTVSGEAGRAYEFKVLRDGYVPGFVVIDAEHWGDVATPEGRAVSRSVSLQRRKRRN